MLSENIKQLRKARGMTQEALAERLNVVRQTVSKWEKGLSVPDSEMLIQLAEVLEVPVSVLLGETVPQEESDVLQVLAARLEQINDQFARQSERRRKVWRIVFLVLGIMAVGALAMTLAEHLYLQSVTNAMAADTAIIGGADGPTSILVTGISFHTGRLIAAVIAAAISIAGLWRTRRK